MKFWSVAWSKIVPPATLLLLASLAAAPLWGPGLLNTRAGGDSPFLLLRTHQMAANLRAGVFPVRWMPDAAYGYGYPFFSHYAALPYYLAAGLNLSGLDILSAIKLTQTLFFVAAALGMYGWGRQALGGWAGAWLAAIAYTFAPFHLVNVYTRGDSLSEFAAFAFYPLILWGLDRLAARPSPGRAIPPGLAYAGLILTHNISALIFSPFVLLYAALHILRRAFPSRRERSENLRSAISRSITSRALLFVLPLLPVLIGLLLSAWYWLPALAELDHVQMAAQTTGYFFYGNHFRGANLVQPGLGFDYAATGGGTTPFAMGLVQAVSAAVGVAIVIYRWLRRRRARPAPLHRLFAVLGLALSTVLITPLSRPLWDHLPLLALTQFPWRFLSVQALFAALLTGVLIAPPRRQEGTSNPWGNWIIAAILAGLLTAAGLGGLQVEYLPIAADEVTTERLQLYELFTGNIGSTIRYEYLPHRVVPRPYTGPALFDPTAAPRATPLDGEILKAEEVVHRPTKRTWRVEAGDGGARVALPLFYWPGWQATVDGNPAEVGPAPNSGYLTLTVPAGEHIVKTWLGRTPLRAAAERISLAAALGTLILAARAAWATTRREEGAEGNRRETRSQLAAFALVGALCIVSCALLVGLAPRFHPESGDLTMEFGEMPYLHHNPAGVDFDGWRMTGYHYNTDRPISDERLRVTLDLDPDPNGETGRGGNGATLRLVSPAAIRDEQLPALAEAPIETFEPNAEGRGSVSVELPIPPDLAPGLYLIRLEEGSGSREPIYLRPVWVAEGDESPAQTTCGSYAEGAARLHRVEATQATPDRLDLRLDWSTTSPLAANYGLSLRLADSQGNEWARADTQPGYGFLPTGLWPVDRLLRDRLSLRLPAGIPPGAGYSLSVILYGAATEESVGECNVPITLNRVLMRPDAPVIASFGDELALSRLEVPERIRQGETLALTAYWLAREQPSADYLAQWRLEGTEQTISSTLPLAPGSSTLPTTWPAGAWIAGRARLRLPPTLSPGEYILRLSLRDPTDGAALGIYSLPRPLRVEEQERIWEPPPMERQVGARFGEIIELAGYNLGHEEDRLRLTLHWRALAAPDRHYMFFVHLADPTTGQPVAQVDTMPRGYTYPTGIWAPGEIVSDEVPLSLENVPPGRYELAVGWYDPETEVRLPAVDRAGSPLPDDRVILPDGITLP